MRALDSLDRARFLIGKKTPWGAGTHTGHTGSVSKRHRGEAGSRYRVHNGTHTGHTGAHGHTDHTHTQTNLTSIQTQRATTHPHDRTLARDADGRKPETAADSTAAGPEPTAPRGRLR